MRRNLEDQIIALAYGELEGAEAEALRERIERDPTLRREHEAYRRQAELLEAVPAVPAPALSTERLRAAVLEQTLRRQRTLPVRFGLAAVAAGALTFVFVQRIAPTEEPSPLAERTAVVALQDLPAPHEWVPSLIGDLQPSAPVRRAAEPPSVGQARSDARREPSRRSTRPERLRNVFPQPEAPAAAKASAASGAAPEAGETVIIVQDGGKAIEMEGTQGVAFGG
jgi:hypothetical protein